MGLRRPRVTSTPVVTCSYVKAALRGVDQTYCTGEVFAAVLKDGTVVTWGDKDAVVCEGGIKWSCSDLFQR